MFKENQLKRSILMTTSFLMITFSILMLPELIVSFLVPELSQASTFELFTTAIIMFIALVMISTLIYALIILDIHLDVDLSDVNNIRMSSGYSSESTTVIREILLLSSLILLPRVIIYAITGDDFVLFSHSAIFGTVISIGFYALFGKLMFMYGIFQMILSSINETDNEYDI